VRGADAIGTVTEKLQALRGAVSAADGQLELLGQQRDAALSRGAEAAVRAELTEQARMLLETYSEEEQEALRRRVDALVGRGLSLIFGEGYGFRTEVGQSRGQAAMSFKIITPEGERDPMQSHGGGVVNVVSFVLRVVVAALTPSLGRTMILDEPFAQLSTEYLDGVALFLRELVDVTGLQLVIVSHEPEIAAVADKAYRLSKVDGVTVVEAA
jgi:DNA repair ATPase RecN